MSNQMSWDYTSLITYEHGRQSESKALTAAIDRQATIVEKSSDTTSTRGVYGCYPISTPLGWLVALPVMAGAGFSPQVAGAD